MVEFTKDVESLPSRALQLCSFVGLLLVTVATSLIALFVAHQCSLWLSLDPERAFERARNAVGIYASIYDTTANLNNAFVEVAAQVIPGWNAVVKYTVEPLVFTALDVFSIAFMKRPYTGILKEDDVPYGGFRCPEDDDATSPAAAWCGSVGFYIQQLGVNQSPDFIEHSTVSISTKAARRLALAVGEPVVGVLDLTLLLDAVQALLASLIVIMGTLSDIVFHVAWLILSEAFELLFNAFLLLVKALASTVLMIVRSGLFQAVLNLGIDFIVVLFVDVLIPLATACLNIVLCLIDLAFPAGWTSQLRCVERVCFKDGSSVFAEVLNTFSSLPTIATVVDGVVSKLSNRATGQLYSSGGVDVPSIDAKATSPRTSVCAACFTCKVPELRAVFMLVGTIFGCVMDGEKYAGRVENNCLQGGQAYVQLCGPRATADRLSDSEWRETYTMHRKYKDTLMQHYASDFKKLASELGGEGNFGNTAHRMASLWFQRDVGLGEDQGAQFIRGVCKQMRLLVDEDGGPEASSYPPGSFEQLTLGLMYESCKHAVGIDTCSVPIGQAALDFGYEVSSCLKSQPACLRDRDLCLGRCGAPLGQLTQDFATTYVKQELSRLSANAIAHGRANCSVAEWVFRVPLFEGGDQFREWSSRARIRGGWNAIDPRACVREPKACAAIQRVVERDPTLTFDLRTGRFERAGAQPPPRPPPRLIQYSDAPPPPPSPPPWYAGLERCLPVVTAAEAGIEAEEERALCLYVRALTDERVPASRCFSSMSPFPPPPPPTPQSTLAAMAATAAQAAPGEDERYAEAHAERTERLNALLDRLGNENEELRKTLEQLRAGRRLFERVPGTGSTLASDNVLELGALGGLTVAQCGALCSSLKNESDTLSRCKGIMYRMKNPDDAADLEVAYCYLLKETGGCQPIDFAASVFSRRDTSGCRTPTSWDNPACVQLSPARMDMRVLDYAAARSSCRQGKHSPRLPRPRSSLEAFSMLAYGRERGVYSFFAQKPTPSKERQLTHWSGLDGRPFYYPGNFDARCILVSTENDAAQGFMFARMEPCSARLADGVICESGSAGPPPPPGASAAAWVAPAPPPPPTAFVASMREFIKREVRPRTEAICLAGLVGSDLGRVCSEFATSLAKASRAGVVGSFMPFCEQVCWHSCGASSSVDVDSFETCRGPECADSSCGQFLERECPASVAAQLQRLQAAACGYVAPSPPLPPIAPPLPPLQPRSRPPPPLAEHGQLREARLEQPSDADCMPVSYSACKRAAEALHKRTPTVSPHIDISQAACEGAQVETTSCFIGCALGNELGVPALFTFQRSASRFMSYRCVDNAAAPFCLCAAPRPPPPPNYDALSILTKDWAFAGHPVSGSLWAQPSGFFKPVAVEKRLPQEFVSYSSSGACRGGDDGAAACTRTCAAQLGGLLRAFHVTATPLPPSPPPPHDPPRPPAGPPSPQLPLSEFRFNGATDACSKNGIYSGSECRDGGVGSVFPAACDYGSQVTLCGHREDVGRGAEVGDDSCATANNGKCEDGGPGTSYWAVDATGADVAVCKLATDTTDCGKRAVEYGPLTYSSALKPPLPPPQRLPLQPLQPPPPPSPFDGCTDTCVTAVCSDGGMGAHLLQNASGVWVFMCDYGSSCSVCGRRQDIAELRADVPPHAFNNFCDDTILGGAAGYGNLM